MAVDTLVDILVGMEDKPTAGVSTKEKSIVAGRNLKEIVATLMGSLVHRCRSKSIGEMNGVVVWAVEVDCKTTCLEMDCRMVRLMRVAKDRP